MNDSIYFTRFYLKRNNIYRPATVHLKDAISFFSLSNGYHFFLTLVNNLQLFLWLTFSNIIIIIDILSAVSGIFINDRL